MTDRPILFSAPMIRALLDGRKTQTRRVVKPQPPAGIELVGIYAPGLTAVFNPAGRDHPGDPNQDHMVRLPSLGDRLWVREAHMLCNKFAYRMSVGIDQTVNPADDYTACVYRLGFDRAGKQRWRPSIHMPRWASRLTLVVTDVRVQRLQDISEADAIAEGCRGYVSQDGEDGLAPREEFHDLWNSINGPDAWAANPWVTATSFTVHHCNIDQMEAA